MPIDYSKYPPNWKTEIVPRILLRADNRCEICGLENKSIVYGLKFQIQTGSERRYGIRTIWFRDIRDAEKVENIARGLIYRVQVILTVAHLDHDELNHDVKDERLKAMCQYCHLNYDAKEKYKRACLPTTTPKEQTTKEKI